MFSEMRFTSLILAVSLLLGAQAVPLQISTADTSNIVSKILGNPFNT